MKQKQESDQEILAISTVFTALKNLESAAQNRVLDYVGKKLNLSREYPENDTHHEADGTPEPVPLDVRGENNKSTSEQAVGDLEGISPVATKWMKRNQLAANQLAFIFSLGVDEIDLVAKSVPGDSKKARMRNVTLLKGVASYLGTGASRFTHEQLKETCLHYDAYDVPNFAKYLKEFVSEITGSKDSGYSLTARGLTSATELVKEIIVMQKGS